MRELKRIILHCSATREEWMEDAGLEAQVEEIRRWHVEGRGWSDIGYHFLIGRDGEYAVGRPLERIGAHVRGHNRDSIGVCLIGGHGSASTDSFHDNFTEEQLASVEDLVSVTRMLLGPLSFHGHNEYAAKACPGFRVAKEFPELVANKGKSIWPRLGRMRLMD